MPEPIKRLEKVIKYNSYIYTQIAKGRKSFVYQQANDAGNIVAYEIFRKKIAKARKIFSNEYPKRELWPQNEDFGKWAWTYNSKGLTMKLFNKIEGINS